MWLLYGMTWNCVVSCGARSCSSSTVTSTISSGIVSLNLGLLVQFSFSMQPAAVAPAHALSILMCSLNGLRSSMPMSAESTYATNVH